MTTFDETTLTLPVRNMHGSNFETLQAEYIDAMKAVNEAVSIASKIDFNSRDYSGASDFQQAKSERMDALRKLYEAYIYFESIAISLND